MKSFFSILFFCFFLSTTILTAESPVVVELFTSQGCHSCPPAEKIFSFWGADQFRQGELIPLAYHVDYWDYIGWKDPFGSSDFTQLQKNYATVLKERSVYTPQLIIGGQFGLVGSNLPKIKKIVPFAREQLIPTEWNIKTKLKEDDLSVNFSVSFVQPKLLKGKKIQIIAVLFENGLITQVTRGENKGKTLRSDFTVRYRKNLGKVDSPYQNLSSSFAVPWSAEWIPSTMGLVVFVQNSQSLHIYSAKSIFPLQ